MYLKHSDNSLLFNNQTHPGSADIFCIELENHERTRWAWQLALKGQWKVTSSQRHPGRGEGGRGSQRREQEQTHWGKTGAEGNGVFADYVIMSPGRFVLISGGMGSTAWKSTEAVYVKKKRKKKQNKGFIRFIKMCFLPSGLQMCRAVLWRLQARALTGIKLNSREWWALRVLSWDFIWVAHYRVSASLV